MDRERDLASVGIDRPQRDLGWTDFQLGEPAARTRVVVSARRGFAEHPKGLVDPLHLLFRPGVTRVAIRVVPESQALVGSLDHVWFTLRIHLQHAIEIRVSRQGCLRPHLGQSSPASGTRYAKLARFRLTVEVRSTP